VGDRIVAVNQVSTSQLSYMEVLSLLRNCRTKKYATVRFQASAHSMMSSLPSDPSTGKRRAVPSADAHLTKKTARDESTLNPWRAAPTPPSEDEYDAVLPMSAKHGLMIRLAERDGLTEFLGYSRYADGGKGPAELRKLIRNEGDRIVAVNGVMASSFPHVCHLIRESKRKADAHCFIRFRDVNSKSYAKVRDRIASDGSAMPLHEPKTTEDELYKRPVGRTRNSSPSIPSYVPRAPVSYVQVPKAVAPASSSAQGQAESKYSAAKVKERIAPDGSVMPVSEPKKTKDGLYQRPAGRTRKGMDWDAVRGIWVPAAHLDS
jgi:hypothetical protein